MGICILVGHKGIITSLLGIWGQVKNNRTTAVENLGRRPKNNQRPNPSQRKWVIHGGSIHTLEPKPTDSPKGFRVCADRRKIMEPPFKQHSRLFQSPRDTVPTPPPAFPRELQFPFPILWFSFL
ncbi:hypothetical protein AVEN_192684-1 [Araneus ventricosus]|uniref:Uncharacterized protein n=1 Tax=Araneus ventricosus TaxID=182803 RepID=A0A4Y2R2R0_ARAVE|nr:hypothetical protein AVEN_192684-1 [Araneus ventricosus]